MQQPQIKQQFCNLSGKNVALLVRAQALLLAERLRHGLPLDWRGVENLSRLKGATQGTNA
jgi:hypothetical protein